MPIFAALSFLAEASSVIEWTMAPWRYLLSSRYRIRKHAQWKGYPMRQWMDLVAGLCGFALGMAIAWLGLRLAIR